MVEINWPDFNGDTPLHLAVNVFIKFINCDLLDENELDQFKIMVESFLFARADPEMENKSGKTPRKLVLDHFDVNNTDELLDAIYDKYGTVEAKLIDSVVRVLFGIQSEIEAEMKAEVDTEPDIESGKFIERYFEHLDHTADIQVHSWGPSLSDAFINAALGMIDYMVPLERIVKRKEILIETGPFENLNEFLFNFMQDVLYAAACDPYFICSEVEMCLFDVDTGRCRAKLKGQEFELKQHGGYGTEVKAITYSAMRIEQTASRSDIWVIVDI